jgi:hypothetical protein
MRLMHSVKNEQADELWITVEPWAYPYRVPRGSVLVFHYEAKAEEDGRVDTELTPDCLVIWFGSVYAPTAELDGKPIEPAWD